jgi:peptidoglycan/LPS O-acetylase OafA/YrhL
MQKYYFLLFSAGIVLFVTIIWLLKRKHLREKYAILWLLIAVAMPLCFWNVGFVTDVSHYFGIAYPPTLVFMASMMGLLLLTLMLSVIDSHQTDRIIALTQKLALLEERLGRIEKKN